MSNLNKVLLMGRLTRDPELRYTPQGTAVTELGLAINREYTPPGSGERRKDTTFVDVTVWKRQAEVVCEYLRKGSPIFIEGRLSFESWETSDGQKRSKLKVTAEHFQFIGGRSGEGGDQGGYSSGADHAAPSRMDRGYGAAPAPASPGGEGGASVEVKEEDIPF